VIEPFDFAVFQTFGYKGLYGGRAKGAANATHFEVGQRSVRHQGIGWTMTENLPVAEDIVKVGRRLKKALANSTKAVK
jgi:DNA-damage-inducible protein D